MEFINKHKENNTLIAVGVGWILSMIRSSELPVLEIRPIH
jgi:hypothetical protein